MARSAGGAENRLHVFFVKLTDGAEIIAGRGRTVLRKEFIFFFRRIDAELQKRGRHVDRAEEVFHGADAFFDYLIVRAFTGADLRTDVRDAMRATQIPCLFIHGTADSTVFFAQGQANFDSCAAEKQLLPVEGAEHTVALMMGGEALRRRVAAFAAEKCGEAEG